MVARTQVEIECEALDALMAEVSDRMCRIAKLTDSQTLPESAFEVHKMRGHVRAYMHVDDLLQRTG